MKIIGYVGVYKSNNYGQLLCATPIHKTFESLKKRVQRSEADYLEVLTIYAHKGANSKGYTLKWVKEKE